MDQGAVKDEHGLETVSTIFTDTCWGCGLHVLLPSEAPVYRCGWCGAITNQSHSSRKPDSPCFSQWRRVRDRFFVIILTLFILFVICGGVWAVYPATFSVSLICCVFHSSLTAILAICTIFSFFLASFMSPGTPANISWGNYSIVPKDGLENYTFCVFCVRPKPPRAHHCQSCRLCVLDMDHHCPFIGNCVGASNHRAFIVFLISTVISCVYIVTMASFAAYHEWPSIDSKLVDSLQSGNASPFVILKQLVAALARSALLLSARGLVLIYLVTASISVGIGISVLLWQQLHYIYEGNTYLDHISSMKSSHGERGCDNLLRFFGCRYSAFRFFLGPTSTSKLLEPQSYKLL